MQNFICPMILFFIMFTKNLHTPGVWHVQICIIELNIIEP